MKVYEHLPDFCCGLAEVGKTNLLVWWAPDRVSGEVQVTAEEEIELPGPQHEVKGRVGGSGEVVVDGREQGKVCRVKPLLSGGRCRTGVVASCDGLTNWKVARGNEVKFMGEAEGGDGGPDAAGADGGGIVGKRLLNMARKGLDGGGAMTGKYT